MLHQLRKVNQHTNFLPMNAKASCRYMKMTTPELLLRCLREGRDEIDGARRRRGPGPPRRPADDRDRQPRWRRMSCDSTRSTCSSIGAGVAGLSVALGLAGARRVLVLSKGDGSTPWAQGGIAAAVEPADDPADHAHDTAVAGAGLCSDDRAALPGRGRAAAGRRADRRRRALRPRAPTAGCRLTLEGGHRRRRVVHAGGDATGAEVARTLRAAGAAAGVEIVDGGDRARG